MSNNKEHLVGQLTIVVVTSINCVWSKVLLLVSPHHHHIDLTSVPRLPPQPLLPAWSITQPGACQAVACCQAIQGNNRAVFKYGQEAARRWHKEARCGLQQKDGWSLNKQGCQDGNSRQKVGVDSGSHLAFDPGSIADSASAEYCSPLTCPCVCVSQA